MCKEKFHTSRNARYCSEKCKKDARKLTRKNWEEANPAYMKEYMQKYRKK